MNFHPKRNRRSPAKHRGILNTGLYAGVVILDTSRVDDPTDYGGLLYELKKLGIRDGESYQIDNCGDLLMTLHGFKKCQGILKKFGVQAINT
ncbi:MAG TPA: hypothetical protein VI546_01280 [candidate division Zixibacteria bacterium]|nr:hypothetical protein [candidate division Zixibacteria bacterium]